MTVFEKQLLNFLLRFYHTFVLQFKIISSSHFSYIFNFLKQVIDSQDIFFILPYNDNVLTNCGVLLKNDHFFCLMLSIYQFSVDVNHFENLLPNEIIWPKL